MYFPVADISANPLVIVLWFMFVGYVFTTIGAAGGILAGVGHISVLGLKDANLVKPMNQVLTMVSPAISAPLYFRERRLVLWAAVLMGVGGIFGALLGSWLSHSYLPDMKSYQPFFGVLTLLIALRLAYEMTPRYANAQRELKQANEAFVAKVKELKAAGRLGELKEIGVRMQSSGINQSFTFAGQSFAYNAFSPLLVGALVAAISSAMGVGGGFLLVPYLTSILGFPIYVVAGTAVASVLISSATSIVNYVRMGVQLDFLMLSIELVGVIIGSVAGPLLSKYFKASWLKGMLTVILFYIGVKYLVVLWGIKV